MMRIFRLIFAFFIVIFYFNKPLYASDFKLKFPVLCSLGQSCWILNYVDISEDKSGDDFTCANRTYKGHTGTDIAVRDLNTANQGIFVRAAAKGRVLYTRADRIDNFDAQNPKSCGNAIVIGHKNGWETRYCHLKEGSIDVKRGDLIEAGQKIAQIGVSGASNWPHLGFELLHFGDHIDPFYGRSRLEGCGLTPKPLWQSSNPMNYQPFAIFNLGFSDTLPDPDLIDTGTFDKPHNLPHESDMLFLWTGIFGTQKGDEVTLTIYNPDRSVLKTESTIIPKTQDKTLLTLRYDNPAHILDAGTYQGIVEITRGFGKSKKSSKWRRLVRLVKVDN